MQFKYVAVNYLSQASPFLLISFFLASSPYRETEFAGERSSPKVDAHGERRSLRRHERHLIALATYSFGKQA
ncbi:MAG: hypothetical protein PUP92_27165 [Rhizonema sp. PD38]|nr:hypothetical protein [Rhizonema sp. PD38]